MALLPRTNITVNVSTVMLRNFNRTKVLVEGVVLFSILICRLMNPVFAGVTLAGTNSVRRGAARNFGQGRFLRGRGTGWGRGGRHRGNSFFIFNCCVSGLRVSSGISHFATGWSLSYRDVAATKQKVQL